MGPETVNAGAKRPEVMRVIERNRDGRARVLLRQSS